MPDKVDYIGRKPVLGTLRLMGWRRNPLENPVPIFEDCERGSTRFVRTVF